jgi:hypothetical protein
VGAALVASVGLSAAAIAQLTAELLRHRVAQTRPPLPLQFDGSTGDLEIDRRSPLQIDILAGGQLVAALAATPDGDELIVYDRRLSETRLRHLGAAIGMAMEEVAGATRWHLPGRSTERPRFGHMKGRRLLPRARGTA